jgi:mannose/cellobiose epimerase-like protein (N-acyl-D-glucosamine 2-epimerase family)
VNGWREPVRDWLRDAALPLWAGAGYDRAAGGFVERLRWDGSPDLEAPKRVRVQARQIYVFAHAGLTGLAPTGPALAEAGWDHLTRHACPNGVEHGFAHLLARDGRVLDATRDTYDHAFVLFALAWLYRVTGREDVRAAMVAVDGFVDAALRHPGGQGFAVDASGAGGLEQNPHMHLLEASLAAFEATGDDRFLRRADALHRLFRERMFDDQRGVLREHFDAGWQPLPGRGDRVEPGHQCEWVWLLAWYARLTGTPLAPEAERLAAFVGRHGRPDGRLLCDALAADGRVLAPATRLWPQTEAIKAGIALAEARGAAPGAEVDAAVAALFATFLDQPVRGAWTDWREADGLPRVDTIPASSLYHLFLALSEYLRACPG